MGFLLSAAVTVMVTVSRPVTVSQPPVPVKASPSVPVKVTVNPPVSVPVSPSVTVNQESTWFSESISCVISTPRRMLESYLNSKSGVLFKCTSRANLRRR